MVRPPRWFRWPEWIAVLACLPFLWQAVELLRRKHLMHPELFYRDIPPIATYLSAVLSLYGVFRLGMLSRWFLLSYPILWVVFYLVVGWGIGLIGFLF